MDSMTYWARREALQLARNNRQEANYDKTLNEYYQTTLDNVQKEIDAFYSRYASGEGLTLSEAKKRISRLDIDAYSRKAKQYVKEKNFSQEANAEMRIYNATMKINRLELLKANIGLETAAGFNDIQGLFDQVLTDRTLEEFKRQAGILGETIQSNAKQAKVIVNASFHNATFSTRVWAHQDLLRQEIEKQLVTGLIQGRNPRVLAQGLRKVFDTSKYNSERLMRTELARVQTEAQKQSFERSGYDQYTFISEPTACPICQGLNGHVFDVKKMMPGDNASPIHPNCRCSCAAYMDQKEFDNWLDNSARRDKMEPQDKGDLDTTLDKLSDNLQEKSLQVNRYLNTLGLPGSMWSGRTYVKEPEDMPHSIGTKKYNCDIWLRKDAGIKTVIHEHLHARSISRDKASWGKYHTIEEATVELLAQEICKKDNISFRKSYKPITDSLKNIIDVIGKADYYDFSKEMISVEVSKREKWLREQVEDYKKTHHLKGRILDRKLKESLRSLTGEE